ncbi:MAG: hypothetical protein ACQES9_04845 [Myxococcota bacterium]
MSEYLQFHSYHGATLFQEVAFGFLMLINGLIFVPVLSLRFYRALKEYRKTDKNTPQTKILDLKDRFFGFGLGVIVLSLVLLSGIRVLYVYLPEAFDKW